MQEPNEKFKQQLIERYVAGEATLKELEAFFGMLSESELDALIEKHMDQEILALREEQKLLKPIKRNNKWKYAIAIASAIALVFGTYLILQNKSPNHQTAQNQIHDIAPGCNKAILTLANGKKISLTDIKFGNVAQQANMQISKTQKGQIVYIVSKSAASGLAAQSSKTTEVAYNTIQTPRGGQTSITLSDGSVAYLDAASSIKFPVAFNGNERKVEITGQVYFEVIHNAAHPFNVKVKGQIIEDLGTHFNINAYDDEKSLKATLLTGKISVTNNVSSVTLKPGQQAEVNTNNTAIKTIDNVDTDQVTAWHRGLFEFHDADIQTVMRQLARWYDVDISYDGKPTDRLFSGKIYRNITALKVSDILSYSNIHFRIEGKKIIVMP